MQARRDRQEVFKVMKSKDLQPSLLCPAKLSFRTEGQIKCFPDKVKLKEFIITKPLFHEMLKGDLFKKNKKIKTVNIKMARKSKPSTTKPKKQTKPTSRTGTESKIRRSSGAPVASTRPAGRIRPSTLFLPGGSMELLLNR